MWWSTHQTRCVSVDRAVNQQQAVQLRCARSAMHESVQWLSVVTKLKYNTKSSRQCSIQQQLHGRGSQQVMTWTLSLWCFLYGPSNLFGCQHEQASP